MPRRRATDPDESDFSSRRGSTLNGHTKWVVFVVSAMIVSSLSAMIWADWMDLKATTRRNETSIAVINANLTQIKTTLQEIQEELKRK